MYTPGGSAWTNESALPRLNRPSELPNAYGTIAPVRTIVLSSAAAASARAVSTIVSVPCVTTTARSAASRQRATIVARPASSISRLSIIMTVSIVRSRRARPRRSISCTCVSRKYSLPVTSSYSLSNVPPVTRILTRISVGPRHHHPQHEVDEYAGERDGQDRDDHVGDAEERDFPAEVFRYAGADAGDHLVARAGQAAALGHASILPDSSCRRASARRA